MMREKGGMWSDDREKLDRFCSEKNRVITEVFKYVIKKMDLCV